MSGQIGEFIAKILQTLQDNGFPEKKVSLPLEKMYEIAAKQGYSFNKVLDFLLEKEGIAHEKTTEKIIFFPEGESPAGNEESMEGFGMPGDFDPSAIAEMMKGVDLEKLKNTGMGGMMMQAASMIKNMSPDQLEKIKSMVENLSDQDKKDLMEKAKKMGLK